MPKIKTHKTASKRFRITKGGKVRRRHASQAHKLEKKSANRKRLYRKLINTAGADVSRIRKMLGA